MRVFAIATLFGLMLACGSDANGPESISGLYTLRTVDGRPPPVVTYDYAVSGFTYKSELLSAWIRIDADNGCEVHFVNRVTQNGAASVDAGGGACTWTLSGSTLTIYCVGADCDPQGEPATATIGGGTLSYTENGLKYVYKR